MAGSVGGTAALITAEYRLALYFHCASHCLNLAVVKSLQVTSVRNMMGVVYRVYVFSAAHPKCQRALEKVIPETQPESSIEKLKDLCHTRWIQHIDSLQIFHHYTPQLLVVWRGYAAMVLGFGPQTHSQTPEACSYVALTITDFISSLVITNSCLSISNHQSSSRG